MTLLTVIQRAATYAGLAQPASVVANTDLTAVQLLAYCQLEGESLARRFGWRKLVTQATLAGDGSTTTFSIPSDFMRFVNGIPLWMDNAVAESIVGPVEDDMWTAYQSGVSTFLQHIWRLRGTYIEIYPALSSSEDVNYEYLSRKWIQEDDGDKVTEWTADNNTSLIPEGLLALGTALTFKRFKGMDDGELARRYDEEFMRETGFDRGAGTLKMGGGRVVALPRGYRNDVRII